MAAQPVAAPDHAIAREMDGSVVSGGIFWWKLVR
jgi:hypothetical protein